MPLTINPLSAVSLPELQQIITGYHSSGYVAVSYTDSPGQSTFSLTYTPLAEPQQRRFDHLDQETTTRYNQILNKNFSFAAFADDTLAGLIIAEPEFWNRSVTVWEFHVRADQRRRGIGRQLMTRLVARATAAGMRTLVCETQNVNAGSIQAYRRLGFRPEGIDISYYTNNDYPNGDIAIFMKRQLSPTPIHHSPFTIHPITPADKSEWLRLRLALWPDSTAVDELPEIELFFAEPPRPLPDTLHAAFVGKRRDGSCCGLLELSIKQHAPGCKTDRIGYLEALFVDPDMRRQGVARALIAAGEQWARERGCREIASDTTPNYPHSPALHARSGYREVVRCFHKPLE